MEKEQKNYRPNVAAVIVSHEYPSKCKIFIALRSDIKDAWQFPQGGIDDGENPREALFRELYEEIGTKSIEVLSEYPDWLTYDFPQKMAEKMYSYDGQKQKYFLVRLKKKAKINFKKTDHPEFSSYKFVELDDVFNFVTHFKKPVYMKVINYFKKEGYL